MWKFIFTILIAGILCGCASGNSADKCLKDNETDLLIKWGDQYNRFGTRIYSVIDAKLNYYKVREDSTGGKIFSDSARIEPENFCKIKQELTQLILATQAMAFPGSTQQFIEYVSPQQNIYFRAIWNPEHTNYGNKNLRNFYDSLTFKATEKL